MVTIYGYKLNEPITLIDPDGRLSIWLVYIIKGAVDTVVAQVTIARANGKSFGDATSSPDDTSIGASFITSMFAASSMSTTAKVATGAVIAVEAMDANFRGENQSIAGVIGENKPVSNVGIVMFLQ